jgi:hypothetical protein
MTSGLIDTGALLKMVYSSLLASIGIAVVFATALHGAIRAADMRRAGRGAAAAAYAALAGLGLVVITAAIIYGLLLIARKT